MKRFMGMMPSSEVEREEQFKVGIGQLIVTIQAGRSGWSILYADGSSSYKDKVDSVDNNFNSAISFLKSQFKDIEKVNTPKKVK